MSFSSRIGTPLALPTTHEKWSRSYTASPNRSIVRDRLSQPSQLEDVCHYLKLDELSIEALHEVSKFYDATPAWWDLLDHLHRRYIEAGVLAIDAGMLPEEFGPAGRLLYAMLFLSLVPHVQRLHSLRGIDPAVTRDTLADLRHHMITYRNLTGHTGLSSVAWTAKTFDSEVFQIGRLQYQPHRLADPIVAMKCDQTLRVLAGDGLRLRPDGQFVDADRKISSEWWESNLLIEPERITGYANDGRGGFDNIPTTFNRSASRIVALHKSPSIAVHIPAGDSLKPDDCTRSFLLADQFYKQHFPGYRPTIATCHSWMMDHQLTAYLPPTSNIIDFQRRFTVYPLAEATDKQTMDRTQANRRADAAPTKLQRIIDEHTQRGGSWRMAAGITTWPAIATPCIDAR